MLCMPKLLDPLPFTLSNTTHTHVHTRTHRCTWTRLVTLPSTRLNCVSSFLNWPSQWPRRLMHSTPSSVPPASVLRYAENLSLLVHWSCSCWSPYADLLHCSAYPVDCWSSKDCVIYSTLQVKHLLFKKTTVYSLGKYSFGFRNSLWVKHTTWKSSLLATECIHFSVWNWRFWEMSNLGLKTIHELSTPSERAHFELQNATFLFEIGPS